MKNKIRFVILTVLLFTLVFSGCKEIPEMDDTIAATVGTRSVSREELIRRIKYQAIIGEDISIIEVIGDYIQDQVLLDRIRDTEYALTKTYSDYYCENEEHYMKNEEKNQEDFSEYQYLSKEDIISILAKNEMYGEAKRMYARLFFDEYKKEHRLDDMTADDMMTILNQHLETLRPASEEIRFNEKVTAQIISEFREMGIMVER